jgi:ElaB/YqjD/DUF883 family membrane-anchored ribosome-binding protein
VKTTDPNYSSRSNSTPSERALDVERTRRELVSYLEHRDEERMRAADESRQAHQETPNAEDSQGIDWAGFAQSTAKSWWTEHPARTAASLAQSAAESYTRRKPFAALAIAAGVGAGLVIARPWRLVSASALVLGLVRSSNLTGMASSIFATASESFRAKDNFTTHPQDGRKRRQ